MKMNRPIYILLKVVLGFYAIVTAFSVLFNGFTDSSFVNAELVALIIVAATLSLYPYPTGSNSQTSLVVSGAVISLIGLAVQVHFIADELVTPIQPRLITLGFEMPLLLALLAMFIYFSYLAYLVLEQSGSK